MSEDEMAVGDHDPMGPFTGGSHGFWIECLCGWIGPACYSESAALASHARHQERQK